MTLLVKQKCTGKIQDDKGNLIDCPNEYMDVNAVKSNGKIWCNCSDGNAPKFVMRNGIKLRISKFAHSIDFESEELNPEWQKFFGPDIMKKIEIFKKTK